MPRRHMCLESMNDLRNSSKSRDAEFLQEYWRQLLLANQRYKVQVSELAASPFLRNDALRLDLNFILLDDDRLQPKSEYFRTYQINEANFYRDAPLIRRSFVSPNDTHCQNRSNQYLLEYIRQMEENYAAMERELMRAKMLVPVMTHNRVPECSRVFHKQRQPQTNGEGSFERSHGHASRNRWRFQQKNIDTRKVKNRERICDPSSEEYYPNIADKCPAKNTFESPRKQFPSFQSQKALISQNEPPNCRNDGKALMESCQSFGKKHEPEISCFIDCDVKHEDHAQTSASINTRKSQPPKNAGTVNNIFQHKSKIVHPSLHQEPSTSPEEKLPSKGTRTLFEDTNIRKQNSHVNQPFRENLNPYNNRVRRSPYERSARETWRNSARFVQKNLRTQRRVPTPRSTVHTAYGPMMQSSPSNAILNPNAFTIQLLRLAVLLYAPALMPALNSLIARQNNQSSIPVPCFEGSNDLLTQVFRILSSQQYVPNLPYAPTCNSQFNENSGSSAESNLRNLSENSEAPRHREVMALQNSQGSTSRVELPENFKKCVTRFRDNASRENIENSEQPRSDTKKEENEKVLSMRFNENSKFSESLMSEKRSMDCEEDEDSIEERQSFERIDWMKEY